MADAFSQQNRAVSCEITNGGKVNSEYVNITQHITNFISNTNNNGWPQTFLHVEQNNYLLCKEYEMNVNETFHLVLFHIHKTFKHPFIQIYTSHTHLNILNRYILGLHQKELFQYWKLLAQYNSWNPQCSIPHIN